MPTDRTILRNVLALSATVLVFGVSFGVLAVAAGLPVSQVCALSLLVYAGGAQFAVVGVVAAGGTAVAAAIAGLLLNMRFVAFGMTVAPLFAGRPPWRRALAAFLLVDATAAMALAQPEPRAASRAYWMTGVAIFTCWNAGTLLGALAGDVLADPTTLGLDAAFPAGFLALLAPLVPDRRTRAAAAAGAVLALALTPLLPPGLPILGAALGALVGLAVPHAEPASR